MDSIFIILAIIDYSFSRYALCLKIKKKSLIASEVSYVHISS